MKYTDNSLNILYGDAFYGENGETWESENRDEPRYRYNGAYVDYCGMSPEDILDIGGGGGKARTYTVTFKDAEGTIITASTYNRGDVLIIPEVPKPEDTETARYTANWQPTPVTSVTKDATYTAVVTCKGRLLIKDNEAGDESSYWIASGNTVTLSKYVKSDYTDPTKYSITWYSGETQYTKTTAVINENGIELNYTPVKKQYTLKFVNEEGESITAYTFEWGSSTASVVVPTVPEKEGYTAAWASTVPATMPAANVVIKPKYTINKYTVAFNDGIKQYSVTANYGTIIVSIAPTPDTREGYTFNGWDIASGATVPANNDTVISGKGWTIKTYTITFLMDDKTVYCSNIYEYNTDIETIRPVDPTKPETPEYTYSFSAWTPALEVVKRDMTYTAVFDREKRSYDITFNYNNGAEDEVLSVEYGVMPVPSSASPTHESDVQYDYIFSRWVPAVSPVTGEQVYTAEYQEILRQYPLVITEIVNGVSDKKEFSIDYGASIILADYIKEPKSEYGDDNKYGLVWMSGDTEITESSFTMDENGIEIKGVYTVREYTLSALDDSGDTIVSASVAYANSISPVLEMFEDNVKDLKPGYAFTGWTKYSGGIVPDTMPTAPVDVKPMYEALDQPLYVNNEQVATYKTDEDFNLNIHVTNREYLDADKYEFHWENSGGEAISAEQTMPNGGLHAYEEPTPMKYKLSFTVTNINSGETELYMSAMTPYHAEIAAPEYTVASGWSFSGWTVAEGALMPAEDVTYDARLEKKTVAIHVTADIAGSSELQEKTWRVLWGEPFALYSAITEEMGFDPEESPEGYYRHITASGLTISGGVTTPAYQEDEYPVSIIDEEFIPSTTIYYGLAPYSAITAATTESHDFINNLDEMEDLPTDGLFHAILTVDEHYAEMEELYNNEDIEPEEFNAYLQSIAKDVVIVAPTVIDLEDYKPWQRPGWTNPVDLTKGQNITIDSTDYTIWFENHIQDTPDESGSIYGYFVNTSEGASDIPIKINI